MHCICPGPAYARSSAAACALIMGCFVELDFCVHVTAAVHYHHSISLGCAPSQARAPYGCRLQCYMHYTRPRPLYPPCTAGILRPLVGRIFAHFRPFQKNGQNRPWWWKGRPGTLLAAFTHGPRYLRPTSDGQTWNNRGYQVVLARYMHQAGFQFGPISVTKRPSTARLRPRA